MINRNGLDEESVWMKLNEPLGVCLLEVMSDGKFRTPKVARDEAVGRFPDKLADKNYDRTYVSTLLRRMRDGGLVERVPPETAGVYQITEVGMVALHRYRTKGEASHSIQSLIRRSERLPPTEIETETDEDGVIELGEEYANLPVAVRLLDVPDEDYRPQD